MRFLKPKISAVLSTVCIVTLAACGSDSTGPQTTDTDGALQSLAIGLGGLSGVGSSVTFQMGNSASKLGQFVDQAQVTIGGKSYTMNALGVRESFPPGTCLEKLFVTPSLLDPNIPCADPMLTTSLIFWQSSSRSAPPDRLLIVAGDPGTIDFSFLQSIASSTSNLGLSMYLDGK